MSQIGDFMVVLSPYGSLMLLILGCQLRLNASLFGAGKPSRLCGLRSQHIPRRKICNSNDRFCVLRFGATGGMLSAKQKMVLGERFDGSLAIYRR
jgi:hypothetical protein